MKMTWLELQEFIEKDVVDKSQQVKVYDFSTGKELGCDSVEIQDNDNNTVWHPFIGVNIDSGE